MKKITLLTLALALIVSTGSVFAYNGNGHNGGGNGHNGGGHNGNGCSRNSHRNGGYDKNGNGHRNGGNSYGHRNGRNNYGYNNQNLTDAQRTELNAIDQKYYAQFESLRSNMRIQSSIINSEMSNDNPDMGKVNTAIEERANLQVQSQKLRVAKQNEVRKVLA